MRHISLYICDPNFSCGLTDGLTKVFHEALADLKTAILVKRGIPNMVGPLVVNSYAKDE